MKKIILIIFALGINSLLIAQGNRTVKQQYQHNAKSSIQAEMVGIELEKEVPITGAKFIKPEATGNRDLTIFSIGESANAYSYGYGGGQKTILWVDDNLDLFINLHRETASTYSGNLAIDISLDRGDTFENNVRVYESNASGDPKTDAARYPQGAVYNPENNTDPEDAYYAFFAPVLDGSNSSGTWGGYGFGRANLVNQDDTTKHLKSTRPGEGIWQYIPDGLTVSQAGIALVTDFHQDWSSGSLVYMDEILLNTGTWDSDENDFEYEESLLDCETHEDLGRPANERVAFAPDGLTGWIVALNDDGSLPFSEGALYPQLYQTTDGGETWEDPVYVQLGGPDGIDAIVYDWLTDEEIEEFFEPPIPERDEILYTTAFDCDIVVDMYGYPHITVVIGIGSGEYSIYTTYISAFDIYTTDGGDTWDAIDCGRLVTFRGTFGDLTEDNRINASTTMDGSKVFVSWLDTDFEGYEDNELPDIYCTGLDISTMMMTETENVTEFTAAWLQAYFFVAPEYVFVDDDEFTIPFTYEDMDPDNPAAPVTYMFIKDFSFTESDFDIFFGSFGANAGPDATICVGSTHQLDGQAWDYSSVEWMTSGDGTFSDASILDPIYTPGDDDIADGEATLTLTAYDENNEASDDMELTILSAPATYAGEDDTICGDQISITDATATNYTSLLWTTSGTGTFSDETTLNPTYSFSSEDIEAGEVTLTLTAYGCEDVSDDKVVTVIAPAYADAGDDATICAGESFTVTTATADNYLSLDWTTSGTGTFTDNGTLTPTYLHSEEDITLGLITLTLTATANDNLCDDVSDDMHLYISPTPTVYAGEDDEMCETTSYELSGFATNWSSLLWTTDGDGTFDDPSLEDAIYTPGEGDIYAGYVTLYFTAQPIPPCTDPESDQMTLNIGRVAQVDAGDDILICTDEFAFLNGTAENTSYFEWSTAGDGTFDDPTSLTTEYYPGLEDQSTGEVDLTLTGWSTEPCDEEVWDDLVLLLQPEPQIEADLEPAICENVVYAFDGGSAYYYSSVMWYTSGDGNFDDPTSLYAVYEPGLQDIESGQVELELILWPVEPCIDELVTEILLSIGQLPVAYAGEDALICEDETYTVYDAWAAHYSSVIWSHNGEGELLNTATLEPTYQPAEGELGDVTLLLTGVPLSPCNEEATDEMVLNIQECTGQNDKLFNGMIIEIFPNPSRGKFMLKIKGIAEELDINITAPDGRIIYENLIPGNLLEYKTEIDISGYLQGVYFIRLKSGTQVTTSKIVLMR